LLKYSQGILALLLLACLSCQVPEVRGDDSHILYLEGLEAPSPEHAWYMDLVVPLPGSPTISTTNGWFYTRALINSQTITSLSVRLFVRPTSIRWVIRVDIGWANDAFRNAVFWASFDVPVPIGESSVQRDKTLSAPMTVPAGSRLRMNIYYPYEPSATPFYNILFGDPDHLSSITTQLDPLNNLEGVPVPEFSSSAMAVLMALLSIAVTTVARRRRSSKRFTMNIMRVNTPIEFHFSTKTTSFQYMS